MGLDIPRALPSLPRACESDSSRNLSKLQLTLAKWSLNADWKEFASAVCDPAVLRTPSALAACWTMVVLARF